MRDLRSEVSNARHLARWRSDLPGLDLGGLDESAILGRGDAFEEVANLVGKLEDGRVALGELVEQGREKAAVLLLGFLGEGRLLARALVAEEGLELLRRLVIARRIEALEMKGARTSVAAQQLTTALADVAEVFVGGELSIKS